MIFAVFVGRHTCKFLIAMFYLRYNNFKRHFTSSFEDKILSSNTTKAIETLGVCTLGSLIGKPYNCERDTELQKTQMFVLECLNCIKSVKSVGAKTICLQTFSKFRRLKHCEAYQTKLNILW